MDTSGDRDPTVNPSTGTPLPTSWFFGDRLDWNSNMESVYLVTELPFLLMVETGSLSVAFAGTDFAVLMSDLDSEVSINDFRDSRSNCGYQGNQPQDFESRPDLQGHDFQFVRRKQRTTLYFKSQCLADALLSAHLDDGKGREASVYLASLCEAHIPVINELVARYRLLTYDYFAYEVSAWDVPVWHVRGGPSGHVPVTLFDYVALAGRPWVIPREDDPTTDANAPSEPHRLALTSVADIAAARPTLAAPGEHDLLDARNLMERGDYSGAVRRATTALEALVEHVLRQELLGRYGEQEVNRRLQVSRTDFPGRLRQWEKLAGITLPDGLRGSIDATRELRHEIVHRGRRLQYADRGLAQRCVDTGRWAYNHIQRNDARTQLRDFSNAAVRSIPRPSLAMRFPVSQTQEGFAVRPLREHSPLSSGDDVHPD